MKATSCGCVLCAVCLHLLPQNNILRVCVIYHVIRAKWRHRSSCAQEGQRARRWPRDHRATRPRRLDQGAGVTGGSSALATARCSHVADVLVVLGSTAAEPGSLRLLPPATSRGRTAPILSTGFLVGRHEAGREGRSRSSSRPPLPRVRREQRQATAAATRRGSWARAVRAPRRPVRERLGVEHAARQERRAEHTTARGRRAATAALSDKTAGMRLLDPAEQKTKGAKSDTPSLVSQGRWTGSGGCARGSSRSCSPSSSTRHAVDRDVYLDTQMLLIRSSFHRYEYG